MQGRDYVACVRLSNLENDTLALPGETCERVPAADLPGLLASDPPAIALASPKRARGKASAEVDQLDQANGD